MKFTFGGHRDKTTALVKFSSEEAGYVERTPSGERAIVLSAGKPGTLTRRKFIILIRQAVALAKTANVRKLAFRFEDLLGAGSLSSAETAELTAQNLELANLEFTKFKSKTKDRSITEVVILGRMDEETKRAFRKGQIIGRATNACRELSNAPGGDMTPVHLAAEAERLLQKTGVKLTVLGPAQIKELNMGGVLGVAKGSEEEPRFIVLEYMNGGGEKPIVLVGKGVTFDTGGVNLKPGDSMHDMHMDMSGGAAVIATLRAAADLKLKRNVIGLIPAVENMPSGSSYRPGDILRSMSGQTIEVLNTDAEGRIILADALTYAERYKPALVIDVATLTGAAVVALGERASALFTKDERLEKAFRAAGEATGDFVWPLPLWEEYESDIKGTFGDWANIGKNRWGGAIDGAIFLYQFAKKYPWVHLDIAPRMTSIEGEFLARGAAGAPVRLLVRILEAPPAL